MTIEICMIIIAAFIVIFVIGLLIVLFQFRRTAKEAEKFLESARQQIVPISHDVTIIMNDTKRIVESFKDQIGKIDKGVETLRDTAYHVKNFEKEIHERIEQPLIEITTFISAFVKVFKGILSHFSKKKD